MQLKMNNKINAAINHYICLINSIIKNMKENFYSPLGV